MPVDYRDMSNLQMYLQETHKKVLYWLKYQCVDYASLVKNTSSVRLPVKNKKMELSEVKVNCSSKSKHTKTKEKVGCSRSASNPKTSNEVNKNNISFIVYNY